MPNAHAPIELPEIFIRIGVTRGTIQVHPDPAVMSKQRGDSVSWVLAANPGEFTIVFAGSSPFDQWVYNQNSARLLRPRPDTPAGAYKYILAISGCLPLDPAIVIVD